MNKSYVPVSSLPQMDEAITNAATDSNSHSLVTKPIETEERNNSKDVRTT